MIKADCEGAELSLFKEPDLSIVKQSTVFAMEGHYRNWTTNVYNSYPFYAFYEEMEKTYLDRVSMRRMVTADDVAGTILFLLSHAGRHISGQSLGVDGNVETL